MLSASIQLEPLGDTFTCSASSPVRPISARPEKLSANRRLTVSAALALLRLMRWPDPAWVKRLAADATASRLVRSAVVLMPNLATAAPPLVTNGTQAPAWNTASSVLSST